MNKQPPASLGKEPKRQCSLSEPGPHAASRTPEGKQKVQLLGERQWEPPHLSEAGGWTMAAQLFWGAAYTHKWVYGPGLSYFLLVCRGLIIPLKVRVKTRAQGYPSSARTNSKQAELPFWHYLTQAEKGDCGSASIPGGSGPVTSW